jgi:hypothetical protein
MVAPRIEEYLDAVCIRSEYLQGEGACDSVAWLGRLNLDPRRQHSGGRRYRPQ